MYEVKIISKTVGYPAKCYIFDCGLCRFDELPNTDNQYVRIVATDHLRYDHNVMPRDIKFVEVDQDNKKIGPLTELDIEEIDRMSLNHTGEYDHNVMPQDFKGSASTRVYTPKKPHRCVLPDGAAPEVGTIERCDDCGIYWVVRYGELGRYWDKVEGWPFDRKARKRIREYEAGRRLESGPNWRDRTND